MKFATVYKPCKVVGVNCADSPSLTQSQYQQECDINAMIRRALSGDMSVFGHPKYLDVLSAPESFHDASNKIVFAKTVWESLSDSVRASYGSPEALVVDFDRQVSRMKAAKDAELKKSADSTVSGEKPASTSDAPAPSNT